MPTIDVPGAATADHVGPTREQFAALREAAGSPDDGPVVMLNLNRYRDRAAYPSEYDGAESGTDVSGLEAYQRYGAVAGRAVAEVGGRPLWTTTVTGAVVACEHEFYDEVLAVWYPSRAEFLRMQGLDWYVPALVHRQAGLERATVLITRGPQEPGLGVDVAGASPSRR